MLRRCLIGLSTTVVVALEPPELGRREVLGLPLSLVSAGPPSTVKGGQLYEVVGDSSAKLRPRTRSVASVPLARAVFLGEHHDSASDHLMQARFIRGLRTKECCVGFEAVQRRYQPVLDAYIQGDVELGQLRRELNWDKEWVWPFERYEPVFRAAKDVGASLLAMNVDADDFKKVEAGGLRSFPPADFTKYVGDPETFSRFAMTPAFGEYVRYVIEPSYDVHRRLGITDMPLANFLGGRLLWDATMAHSAATWCLEHPQGSFVGLIGSDHVKFGCGVPARFAMSLGVPRTDAIAVMLNPSPRDTSQNILQPDQDFVLQLRFTDSNTSGLDAAFQARQTSRPSQSVLTLADFLWYDDVVVPLASSSA